MGVFFLFLGRMKNVDTIAVLDCIWFCHDPHFVIDGTEDMTRDYHDMKFNSAGSSRTACSRSMLVR